MQKTPNKIQALGHIVSIVKHMHLHLPLVLILTMTKHTAVKEESKKQILATKAQKLV